MKILFIANELRFTCGVTNHLLHLAKGLSDSNEIFILCGGGNGLDRFRDINCRIINEKIFLHSNRDIRNYLFAVNYLRKFVKENKIEILHSHSHYAANIAYDVTKVTKVKTVQTNHGILNFPGKLKHFCADNYVAVNEHILNYLLKNNIADEKEVVLIRCGIPVPDKPSQQVANPITILSAARFTKEKGLDVYLKAVLNLNSATRTRAKFRLAGEGEEENNLSELNENLKSGVEFLGRVSPIDALLSKNNIFVFCSRSTTEGFPAVLTEAGAFNNLVITSRFPGLENVFENGTDGFTFEIDDSYTLTKLLEEAIDNYPAHYEKSLHFYNKVKDLFHFNTMIEKHIQLYKSLLNK